MKRTNNKLSFFAPVLLLLVALLGMAGCSQSDDAPAGTVPSSGGEPLHIRIAPKPGFPDTDPTTRATVDDAGAFKWDHEDPIYITMTFNDAAPTRKSYTAWYNASHTTGPIPSWQVRDTFFGFDADLSGLPVLDEISWPIGATTVAIKAFHTDLFGTATGANPSTGFRLDKYSWNTGGHMFFEKTFSQGDAITLDLKHLTTRLVFPKLTSGTYSLKVNGADATFLSDYKPYDATSPFGSTRTGESFVANSYGLIIYVSLNDKIQNGKINLELLKDGVAVYAGEIQAQGTVGAYKVDGVSYKIDIILYDGGSVNPDNTPGLLPPHPIVAGNKVWEVNGYYVTAPNADVDKRYQWNADPTATAMLSDPCVGHGNWLMPTMKDFEVMAGWTEILPWSQGMVGSGSNATDIASDVDAWNAAFPTGDYWSSVAHASDTNCAWVMSSRGGSAFYNWASKDTEYYVRCVQPK